jgi:hypothetical protein
MMHHADQLVMPGLDPGIRGSTTGAAVRGKDVDSPWPEGLSEKLGHDDNVNHMFVFQH